MSDFEAQRAGHSGSWSPNMHSSDYKYGQEVKARETAPFPSYGSSSPSSTPSYSSPSYTYGSSPSYSSSSYGSGYSSRPMTAAEAEAAAALAGLVAMGAVCAVVVATPIFILYECYKHFPNETTFAIASTALTGAVVASDWVRPSKGWQIGLSLAGLTATGLGIWGLQANHAVEGVIPQLVTQVATQNPQGILTAGIALGGGLFAKSLWEKKWQLAAIPAALTLVLGTIDGIGDGVANKEINPLNAGGKAFVDTARVTAVASKWYVGNEVPGLIVTLPYEASAFVGGFVGDTVTDGAKYVVIPTFKYIWHQIAKHIPPDTTDNNVSTSAAAAAASPAPAETVVALSPPVQTPTVQQEAAQTASDDTSPDNATASAIDQNDPLPGYVTRQETTDSNTTPMIVTGPVKLHLYAGNLKYEDRTVFAPAVTFDNSVDLQAGDHLLVLPCKGYCEVVYKDPQSGQYLYGIVTQKGTASLQRASFNGSAPLGFLNQSSEAVARPAPRTSAASVPADIAGLY